MGWFARKSNGDDGLDDAERACKKQACAIQKCLSSKQYQETQCREVIQKWERCVERFRAAQAEEKNVSSSK